jgi:hypothetical protein
VLVQDVACNGEYVGFRVLYLVVSVDAQEPEEHLLGEVGDVRCVSQARGEVTPKLASVRADDVAYEGLALVNWQGVFSERGLVRVSLECFGGKVDTSRKPSQLFSHLCVLISQPLPPRGLVSVVVLDVYIWKEYANLGTTELRELRQKPGQEGLRLRLREFAQARPRWLSGSQIVTRVRSASAALSRNRQTLRGICQLFRSSARDL